MIVWLKPPAHAPAINLENILQVQLEMDWIPSFSFLGIRTSHKCQVAFDHFVELSV